MIHSHQTIPHSRIGGKHIPLHRIHKDCNTQENMVGVTAEESSTSIVYNHCDCTMELNLCYNKTANVCYDIATRGNPTETEEESEGIYCEISEA